MDRRWSALCAAVMAAQTLLQMGAAEGAVRRTRPAPEVSAAVSLALEWELGLPRQWARLLRRLTADEPGADGSSGQDAEVFAPGEAPESPAASADADLPVPEQPAQTEEPSPPEETPAPTAEPDPTRKPAPGADEPETGVEIRPFTDTPGVAVKNNTGFAVDIPALMGEELTQRLPAEGPQILVLHTHGTEAYMPVPGETYQASDPYRTTDPEHSVIRVGDVLCQALESCGLRVVHDRELYDYPSYTGCYSRSQAAAERWLAMYPDIAVIIDLHRDAVGTEEVVYKTCAQLSGDSAAQVMLVIGTGENGLDHPLWRENLKLALALQSAVDRSSPTLTRPIHLAQERYNQQLTTGSFILEVGTNGNTLSEAERAAELFARAAAPVLLSLAD